MQYNATQKTNKYVFGEDSVVIQKYISGIKGGRTLDCTGFTGIIYAGHVIIKKDGVYKPLGAQKESYNITTDSAINSSKTYYTRSGIEGAYIYTAVASPVVADIATYYEKTEAGYNTLASGEEVAGILYRSIPVEKPLASIMTNGEVNKEALPYPLTTAIKNALPHIVEVADEVA